VRIRSAYARGRLCPPIRDGSVNREMRAIVLAGGLGTRLRPYTTVIPKPLVPIGDRPVLEHIIRSLAAAGVDRVDLCVNHLGQLIRSYLAHADLPPGLQLAFHWETQPLGTAGAVAAISDLEGSFIVMNGDVLTTLDYRELVDFHREKDAALTIAMHGKRVDIDLGVIESQDGLVLNYIEKPSFRYRVSTGVYVYDERALRHLREEPCQFPELVLRLLAANERVAAWETDAEWFDIGTVGEYERAAADVERRPERYNMEPLDLPPLEAPLALAPVDGPSQGDWRLTANGNGGRP
jgi:NDP-mannose synthase